MQDLTPSGKTTVETADCATRQKPEEVTSNYGRAPQPRKTTNLSRLKSSFCAGQSHKFNATLL